HGHARSTAGRGVHGPPRSSDGDAYARMIFVHSSAQPRFLQDSRHRKPPSAAYSCDGVDSPHPPEGTPNMLQLQTWITVMSGELRDRYAEALRQRPERGATTLEYVVIAAAVFVAAVALVGIIIGVINREQAKIE